MRLGRGVHIGVAEPFKVREHRHARLVLHPLDQPHNLIALASYSSRRLHVLLDWSDLHHGDFELLQAAVSYGDRALRLFWRYMGMPTEQVSKFENAFAKAIAADS